jgi:16S rRNA processing protein RimM
MGRVAAPYGVKGWIKVQVFSDEVDALLDHPTWWIGRDQDWMAFTVAEGKAHGATVVARLEGVDVREAAADLKGLEIAVPRERLPATADGEHYWTDLEGMEVLNREGRSLGRVETLFSNGAQSVLVVRTDAGGGELLIPFVSAYVDGVDAAARRIRVDWQPDWA